LYSENAISGARIKPLIALAKISQRQRCMASCPTKNEESDKTSINRVASKRLQSIFYAFKRVLADSVEAAIELRIEQQN